MAVVGSAPALAKVRAWPSPVRISDHSPALIVADRRVFLFVCREIGRADYGRD